MLASEPNIRKFWAMPCWKRAAETKRHVKKMEEKGLWKGLLSAKKALRTDSQKFSL